MRVRVPLLSLAMGCLLALAVCKRGPSPDLLLSVDGIDVTFGDLKPYTEFLGRYWVNQGKQVLMCKVLSDHVLPLLMARRAFPKERAKQLELAKGLCAVAGNAIELQQQAGKLGMTKHVTPGRVEIPTAMFLFDDLRAGSVSEPIELPHGYLVCAALTPPKRAAVAVDDEVEIYQVGFLTQDRAGWDEWLFAAQKAIADKVTYVHPDYRDALPPWLKAPSRNP